MIVFTAVHLAGVSGMYSIRQAELKKGGGGEGLECAVTVNRTG